MLMWKQDHHSQPYMHCPVEPFTGFWKVFFAHLSDSCREVVFWTRERQAVPGTYQNTSFLPTQEFPRLTYCRVIRLIAIDNYNCGHKIVEKCKEGML